MTVKDTLTRSGSPRFSLEDQARALALVLRNEFGVPFTFFDAASGASVRAPEDSREPVGFLPPVLSPGQVIDIAAAGRARITPLPGDRFQVVLFLHEGGRAVLVAVGEMASSSAQAGAGEEQTRLEKWAQAVCDRLRLTDQLLARRRQDEDHINQVQSAWEVTLAVAHLTRNTRIHKEPLRNRQRILQAGLDLLGAQTLIWVPLQHDAPVMILGQALLAPLDCHQLAAALAKKPMDKLSEPIVMNEFQKTSWGARFLPVVNLMAFALTDNQPIGWVIALNKKKDSARDEGTAVEVCQGAGEALVEIIVPFRRSDAALLTPFVALVELHARASRRYQDLKDLLVGLTRSLTAALDAKDSYTFGHSERVARIAVELGRELGLEGDDLADVYLAGLLHDVGKIGIRDAVLGKEEALTSEEFEHIKRHVTIGYSILSDLRQIRNLLPGVLYHHERWDGTGYPEGLAGEAVPLLARILAVADAYDAMSTTRPYRNAIPYRRVEEILHQGAGVQWDRRVVEAFMRCRQKVHTIRQRGVGESLQQALDGVLRIDRSISDVGVD